jgi:hypothetical protein
MIEIATGVRTLAMTRLSPQKRSDEAISILRAPRLARQVRALRADPRTRW